MKILFLGRHYTYFRNFESVLRELAGRGHSIHAAVERGEEFGGRQLVEDLAARYPGITHGESPTRAADDDWGAVAAWVRLGLEFLRYQHPTYDAAAGLRTRARERTPAAFLRAAAVPVVGRATAGLQAAVLRRLERALPENPAVRAYLEAQRPDLLLITPLIGLGSSQIDYLRVARAMRIPTALCVWSWDHLSSKARIRERIDRVLLWNETQKREAMELHGVPASRIVVTGAQCFDQWFDRRPSRDRETFCRQIGLSADRPVLLYVCSALLQGSPKESPFVLDWIRRVRASASPIVSKAGILVRPHPSRLADWEGVDLSRFGDVVLWGRNPVDVQARHDYFDSLHHAAAVVGLNTSAFIEAAIAGTPVLTVLPPEYHDNQMGTLHFRYLRSVGGGLLTVAETFDAHLAHLEGVLTGTLDADASRFVREFVRPHGLEIRATDVFADAVDALGRETVESEAPDPLAPVWRGALGAVRAVQRRGWLESWFLSPREHASVLALRAASAGKLERNLVVERTRDAAKAARAGERQQRQAVKTARAAAHEERKLQQARDARAGKRREHRRRQLRRGWLAVSRLLGASRPSEER